MDRKTQRGRIRSVTTRSLVATFAGLVMIFGTAIAAPVYSGPDWVDSVPLGTHDDTWQASWNFGLHFPNGQVESINATGTMDVRRSDAIAGDGVFDIEILSMSLIGSSSMGPLTLSEILSPASIGRVTETGPTTADSAFQLFVELDTGGVRLGGIQPVPFSVSGITGYPPDGAVYSSSASVPLFFLATGDPSGFAITGPGEMTIAFDAAVIPLPAAAWLFATALVGFAAFTRRARTG